MQHGSPQAKSFPVCPLALYLDKLDAVLKPAGTIAMPWCVGFGFCFFLFLWVEEGRAKEEHNTFHVECAYVNDIEIRDGEALS